MPDYAWANEGPDQFDSPPPLGREGECSVMA